MDLEALLDGLLGCVSLGFAAPPFTPQLSRPPRSILFSRGRLVFVS